MEIKNVSISKILPAEYNPRNFSAIHYDDLKESIQEFGLVDPVIVNGAPNRKNILIGGHFRLKVAKDLGFKEVPVVYVNLPDIEREKELNLRLNKNLGQWDWELLAKLDENLLLKVGFEKDEILMKEGLGIMDDISLDPLRFEVITVEPPEAPILKERGAFRFKTLKEYQKIRKFFAKDGNQLDGAKLLRLIA